MSAASSSREEAVNDVQIEALTAVNFVVTLSTEKGVERGVIAALRGICLKRATHR
jgi:hypothetical protein